MRGTGGRGYRSRLVLPVLALPCALAIFAAFAFWSTLRGPAALVPALPADPVLAGREGAPPEQGPSVKRPELGGALQPALPPDQPATAAREVPELVELERARALAALPAADLETAVAAVAEPASLTLSALLGVEAGTVLSATLFSAVLQRDLPYRIYLPPGYDRTDERYPVVYLLHGLGGDVTEWTEKNYVGLFADALITEGRIGPLIMVMPEGYMNYFMNHANGGERWADYVVDDVVRYVDAHYRTIPSRAYRAVGGNSMGAHAALQLSFNRPDVFATAMANSPSLRTDPGTYPYYYGSPQYYADYDPLQLVARRSGLDRLRIWLDIGDEDQWFDGAAQLHDLLLAQGLAHEWQVYPGGHHWTTYWIEHLPAYLAYYDTAFAAALLLPPEVRGGGEALVQEVSSISVDSATRQRLIMAGDGTPTPAAMPPAAQDEQVVRRAIALMVRGLRVYAALPSSPYVERQALKALAGFKAGTASSAALAQTVRSLTPAIEKAMATVDADAMRLLADELQRIAEQAG